MKVSIVICYTDKATYDEACSYIGTQSFDGDIEIVGIDNSCGKYSSAAQALNAGAAMSHGEIIIWMHQDVLLYPTDAVADIAAYLAANSTDIVGIAGAKQGMCNVYSAITETREHIVRYGNVINEPTECETLDECLIATTRETWANHRFDEKTCNDWHLYAVDMSLTVRKYGGKAVILPIKACHLSKGNITFGFYKTLKRLVKKYLGVYDYIYTTCITMKVSMRSINTLLVKLRLHRIKALLLRQN